MNVKVVATSWAGAASRDQLLVARQLVYDSFREFYDLFSENTAQILECIENQLQEPGSEVGAGSVVIVNGELVGIYTHYPSVESRVRQLVSLRNLLRIADLRQDCLERLAEHSTGVEPIPFPSLLGTRFAVRREFRGKGFGKLLVEAHENATRARGYQTAAVHVRHDNAVSNGLMKSLGYHRISEGDYRHILLAKDLV